MGDAVIENALFLINGIILMTIQLVNENKLAWIPITSSLFSFGSAIMTYYENMMYRINKYPH